jgi:hypothetical protein
MRDWFRRLSTSALVGLCAVFIVLPPTVAYAADVQINYGSGSNGVGVVVATRNYPPQYSHRMYNQVWHQAGKSWTVWYQDHVPYVYCNYTNTNNPTKCPNASDDKEALAQNNNDNSGVIWTAQTTKTV